MNDNVTSLSHFFKQYDILCEVEEIEESTYLLTFDIEVRPGQKKERFETMDQGILKVYLRERALEGKANQRLTSFLSKEWGISKSSFEILRGEKSKRKKVGVLLNCTGNKNFTYYWSKFNSWGIKWFQK